MKKPVIISFIFILMILAFTTISSQAASVYYVKSGDTLWKIANNFNVSLDRLYQYNNISENSWLYVGQKLIIRDTVKNKTNSNIYYVKTGDTLWEIAQKYNITVEDILTLNQLSNYNIYIGQKLYIYENNNDYDDNNDNNSNNSNNKQYVYYTIKSGDILWNIAQKYETSVQKLVELNNIKNAYDLYIGRQLIIPLAQSNNDNTPVASISNPYYFYRVKENDRVWSIADRFGVRVSELLNYNDIGNVNEIEKGTLLVIPLQKSNKLAYVKRVSSVTNNYYRVDGNDTLADIAEYYNVAEEGLRAINHLTAEENIYTGQKLLMPVSPALFAKHKLYSVKTGGEYLFDIAYNHKVSIKSILKANYLKNPNIKFEEGTKIIISLTEKSKVTWIDYENGEPVNSWIF